MTAQAGIGTDGAVGATTGADLRGLILRLVSDTRVRFLVAGGINTVFGFGTFAGLQVVLGHRWGYMLTLAISHIVTVLFAFVVHRRLTFRVTGPVLRDLWRFESVYLFALGLNAILLPLLVEFGRVPVLAAQAVVTVVNALLSWVGHSRFSFRRTTR